MKESDRTEDNDNPLATEAGTDAPDRLPQWKTSGGSQSNSNALASPDLNLSIDFGVHYLIFAEQEICSQLDDPQFL